MSKESALHFLNLAWTAAEPLLEPREGMVLIDLMHNIPEYIFRSLVVGKFVSIITGYPVKCLVGIPGVMQQAAPFDREQSLELMRAFCFSQHIDVPSSFQLRKETPEISRLMELANSGKAGDFVERNHLKQIQSVWSESDKVPLGILAHQTNARGDRAARIKYGERLKYWISQIGGFDDWASENLLNYEKPIVFVTGHVDYMPWGQLSHKVISRGGRVVWFRSDDKMPINFIDHLSEGETLNGAVRNALKHWFSDFEAEFSSPGPMQKKLYSSLERLDHSVRKGLFRSWTWHSRTAENFEMPSFPGRVPTYILFAHALTDQNVTDISLFPDHFSWICSTLSEAAASEAFNVLVKAHPLDSEYDQSGALRELDQKFCQSKNVSFAWTNVPFDDLFKVFDAGITVRGTPGQEMPAAQLPMILAGRGHYSDCDFCHVPTDIDEYFSLLRSGPRARNLGVDARRAKLFSLADRVWCSPSTSICPPFKFSATASESWWSRIEERARYYDVLTDPVLDALRNCWSQKNARVADNSALLRSLAWPADSIRSQW